MFGVVILWLVHFVGGLGSGLGFGDVLLGVCLGFDLLVCLDDVCLIAMIV